MLSETWLFENDGLELENEDGESVQFSDT